MVCKSWRNRAAALAVFAALTTPFGTFAHLASEAASLGEASLRILVSPDHAYLWALNCVAVFALMRAVGGAAGDAELRRRVALAISQLPGRGRGRAFFVTAVLWQLAFFAVTQAVEGDPIAAGHVVLGLIAAVLASLLGAIFVGRWKFRILHAIAALEEVLSPRPRSLVIRRNPRQTDVHFIQCFASPSIFSRPPPLRAI